jgi:hypothetical protein
MEFLRLVVILVIGCSLLAVGVVLGQPTPGPGDRDRFDNMFKAGNYKEAYEGYRALALDAKSKSESIPSAFERAIQCLINLGRIDEIDAFRDAAVAVHQRNWRLLEAAAASYLDEAQHFGTMIAGKFHRGGNVGGGRAVNSYEHDRSRALQLLVQALEHVRGEADRAATGRFYLTFARVVMGDRNEGNSWRLQSLTPLDVPADYDENNMHAWGGQQTCAPVRTDGTPVYYSVPARLEDAKNDGERWRWALAQAAEANPRELNTTRRFFDRPIRYSDVGRVGAGQRLGKRSGSLRSICPRQFD